LQSRIDLKNIEHIDPLNHISCRSNHIFSYLKSQGVQICPFFYGALEDTNKIYNEIILKKKVRWTYETQYLRNEEDFALFGIKEIRKTIANFELLEAYIQEKLNENKVLFFWCDRAFFNHWFENTHQLDGPLQGPHYFILHGYIDNDDNKSVFITDNFPANIYAEHQYDLNILKASICSDNYLAGRISYFEFDNCMNNSKNLEIAKTKFKEKLIPFNDDFSFYDHIITHLEDPAYFNSFNEMITCLDHAFALISGAKCFLTQFLEYVDYPQVTIDLSQHIYKSANILKQKLVKIKLYRNPVTIKNNLPLLQKSCAELKKLEVQFLQMLKEGMDSI
jgi:hypothetical protein